MAFGGIMDVDSGKRANGRERIVPWEMFAVLLAVVSFHLLTNVPSEPFFNGDETRHVMTGAFFADMIRDGVAGGVRGYTTQYYLQYPALGVLVWPPLFYIIEGLFMLALGTSVTVSKGLELLALLIACVYLYRLVRSTHGRVCGALACWLFAFSPLVLTFSRQVMLEIPTVAFCMVALFHYLRFVDGERRADLIMAAGAACGAALTRFDGVFLLAVFVLIALQSRKARLFRRRDVMVVAGISAALVSPFYLLTASEFGSVHAKSIIGGAVSSATVLKALVFYPRSIPDQIGWLVLVFAVIGLMLGGLGTRTSKLWPYVCLTVGVYVTFTPIASRESRHAIYWVPGICAMAAEGVAQLSRRADRRWVAPALGGIVAVGTVITAARQPTGFVHGYDRAARYVTANIGEQAVCFFDGWLDGDFIYQLRRQDPRRRIRVIRGDKLLYSIISGIREEGYWEYSRTDEEILDTLFKYDPALIVVESRAAPELPVAYALRRVLSSHLERFRLETVIPIDTNMPRLRGSSLVVYRNVSRNPSAAKTLEFEMPALGRKLTGPLR
jgi:hypothetical protein